MDIRCATFCCTRNSHFQRIAMVQAIAALEVLLAPEVLWIVHVRIVIEPVPVHLCVVATPRASVSALIGCGGRRRRHAKCDCKRGCQYEAIHRDPPRMPTINLNGNCWMPVACLRKLGRYIASDSAVEPALRLSSAETAQPVQEKGAELDTEK